MHNRNTLGYNLHGYFDYIDGYNLADIFFVFCNSEIDREEFMKVMTLMQAHNRQGADHSNGLRAGHKLGSTMENGGLLEYFFGKDGKTPLEHDRFVQFLRDLHEEVS